MTDDVTYEPPRRWKRWVFFPLAAVVATGAGLLVFNGSDDETPQQPLLPKEDREFLWDAEHRGLELTRYGFSSLRSGLSTADRDEIDDCLSSDFVAHRPTHWRRDTMDSESFQVARAVARADADFERLDREEFVAYLTSVREEFDGSPDVRFKLTAIRPVDRKKPKGQWEGTGRLTISGTSNEGGPCARRIDVEFRTPLPSKSRMEEGQWLNSCRITRDDRVAARTILMREVAAEWGIDSDRLHDNWESSHQPVNTGGVYLCDYNRDGFVDMLVADSVDGDGLILYKNLPDGGFEDVSEATDLPRVRFHVDAIFADLDGDGWEDLIVPSRYVMRNVEGQYFEDMTGYSNLDDAIYERAGEEGLHSITGVSVVDYDRDGRLDLYLTRGDTSNFDQGSWIDGKSGLGIGNQLFRNLGDWQFEDVTSQTGTDGDKRSTFTSVWLDANNDRWPDIYIIHEFGAGLLLLNERGASFRQVELTTESSDFGSMGLTCGDIDNDGNIDLYVSNMYSSAGNRVMDNLPKGFYDDTVMHKLRRMVSGNQLHRNLGELSFQAKGDDWDVAQVGWGWGPSLVDLNNDGWLDIYATCGFMSRYRDKPDG